nr:hypothetical protein Iba_chr07aCG6420 [Ipomoea batatas]
MTLSKREKQTSTPNKHFTMEKYSSPVTAPSGKISKLQHENPLSDSRNNPHIPEDVNSDNNYIKGCDGLVARGAEAEGAGSVELYVGTAQVSHYMWRALEEEEADEFRRWPIQLAMRARGTDSELSRGPRCSAGA